MKCIFRRYPKVPPQSLEKTSENRSNDEAAGGGDGAGSVACPDGRAVLAESEVSDVVKSVLNAPVIADELEESARRRSFRGQVGGEEAGVGAGDPFLANRGGHLDETYGRRSVAAGEERGSCAELADLVARAMTGP